MVTFSLIFAPGGQPRVVFEFVIEDGPRAGSGSARRRLTAAGRR